MSKVEGPIKEPTRSLQLRRFSLHVDSPVKCVMGRVTESPSLTTWIFVSWSNTCSEKRANFVTRVPLWSYRVIFLDTNGSDAVLWKDTSIVPKGSLTGVRTLGLGDESRCL